MHKIAVEKKVTTSPTLRLCNISFYVRFSGVASLAQFGLYGRIRVESNYTASSKRQKRTRGQGVSVRLYDDSRVGGCHDSRLFLHLLRKFEFNNKIFVSIRTGIEFLALIN